MKLIKLCLSNIKQFLTKRTVIALVLLLGIIISSCAMNVYYSQSVAMSNTLTGYSSVEKAIDFQAGTMTSADYESISVFLSDYTDELDFYSVMSTQLEDVDIIGIKADTQKIGVEIGEWVTETGQIVVPYEINGEYINVGDTYNLDGKDYTVCGVYNPMGYQADLYSSKRISQASFAATGVESEIQFDEENPYDFSDREVYGVFIMYSDFVENEYVGEIFRVKFLNSFSDAFKDDFVNDFIANIVETTGNIINAETNAMDKAGEVYGVQFISKFLIYILITVLSLINTLTLFAYVLKQNKKDFLLYKSLGATNKKLLLVTAIESAIYIIIAYTLGFAASKYIVNHTDLKGTVPYYGLKQYLLLLAVVLIIALIYILISQYMLLKKQKDEEPLLNLRSFIKKTGFKKLYLLLKNYSSGILSEAIIFLQVMLVAFSFTYVASFYFERGASMRLAERMTNGNETYLYTWNSKMMFEVMENFDRNSLFAQEAQEKIKSLEGINSYGCANCFDFHLNVDKTKQLLNKEVFTLYNVRSISPSIIEKINTKVSKGVWLDEWKDGVDIAELGYIPVVISENFADDLDLKCGDTLENNGFWFNRESWKYVETDEYEYWDISNDTELFNIKIVGILDNNSNVFLGVGNPPTLGTVFYSVDSFVNKENQYLIYSPYVYKNDKLIIKEGVYDGQTLLFPDGTKDIEYYREQMESYGYVYTMEELAYRDDDYYLTGTSEYEIHFYVTVALLIIGVIGYNLLSIERNKKIYGVYFSCGMPFKKAIGISMGANAVIFVLGGVIGSLWGLISADSTRGMMLDTKIYSICTAIGFIIVMFLISSITMFIQMAKLSPVNMIRKGK